MNFAATSPAFISNFMPLKRLLNDYLNAELLSDPNVVPTLCPSTVTNWDYWSAGFSTDLRKMTPGMVRGFNVFNGQYSACIEVIPSLAKITGVRTERHVSHQLRCLGGFFDMPAEFCVYKDFQEALEHCSSSNRLYDEELTRLAERKTHQFVSYSWDDRIFLSTGMTFEQLLKVYKHTEGRLTLCGNEQKHELFREQIELLNANYSVFVVPGDEGIMLELQMSMQLALAPYYHLELPPPFSSYRAIFLPKENHESSKAADIFTRSGVINLGSYLESIC